MFGVRSVRVRALVRDEPPVAVGYLVATNADASGGWTDVCDDVSARHPTSSLALPVDQRGQRDDNESGAPSLEAGRALRPEHVIDES